MLQHFLSRTAIGAALTLLPLVSLAADIAVTDPYVRVSRPNAPTGAAFMVLTNQSDKEDRLVSASSDVAKRVELHTHVEMADGVMRMTELEGGIVLPAGGSHIMKRGGDHVMLMGLVESLEQDQEVTIVLTFENAGDVSIAVPVDNERMPDHGAMDHGTTEQSAPTQ